MAREDLHFRLRIPEELKGRIEIAAAHNHRSMTAEIIARLEDSFAFSGDFDQLQVARGMAWRLFDVMHLDPDDPCRIAVVQQVALSLANVSSEDLSTFYRATDFLQVDLPKLELSIERRKAAQDVVFRAAEEALDRLAERMRALGWTVEAPPRP